jgi:hypothetical protein
MADIPECRLGRSGRPDLLERRDRLLERALLPSRRDPDTRARTFHRPAVVGDDEERVPDETRPEIAVAVDEGDVWAALPDQRIECALGSLAATRRE